MTYDELSTKFRSAKPLILLRGKNAPFMLSFFYKVFKEAHVTTIYNADLRNKLEGFMDDLEYEEYDEELEANSLFDDYSLKASQYIDKWSNAGFLRKYPNDEGQDLHELTADTQKVMKWIEDLEQREFVGTNSRFKDIFFKIQEMVELTTENVELRITELEKKKWEIEDQINLLKNGKTPKIFDDTEIRERFYELNKTARELLSDFTEVEQNFENIRKEIHRKYAEKDVAKGTLLVYALDALDEIESKDQGKSFKAFWEFLMDDKRQKEFADLTEQLYRLLKERNIDYNNDRFLKHLKRYLHASGRKVIDSNKKLSEKISKVLSEKNQLQRRRAFELIGEIRQKAFLLLDSGIKDGEFIEFEDEANIDLFDRWRLYEAKDADQQIAFPGGRGGADIEHVDLTALFSQFALDKKKLQAKIDLMLQEKTQVTLKEITERFPIENGLTEVIGYFAIAAASNSHIIFKGTDDPLFFGNKKVNVPMVMYIKL